MITRKMILLMWTAALWLSSCQCSVEGISIGNTLAEQQDFATNRKFCTLVKKSLDTDATAFMELVHFNCGGAAGCYDLGSVITQIIFKLGEDKFLVMTQSLSARQKGDIKSFISVGLEYGYPLNPNSPNLPFEDQFPKVAKAFSKY